MLNLQCELQAFVLFLELFVLIRNRPICLAPIIGWLIIGQCVIGASLKNMFLTSLIISVQQNTPTNRTTLNTVAHNYIKTGKTLWLGTLCYFRHPSRQSLSFRCRYSLWTKQGHAAVSTRGSCLDDVNRLLVVTNVDDSATQLQKQYRQRFLAFW